MGNEEIELNGVTYVRKDSVAQAKPTNTEGMLEAGRKAEAIDTEAKDETGTAGEKDAQ